MINTQDAAEIFVPIALAETLDHPVYISGGHLVTVGEMAAMVREIIPEARITTGDRSVPHAYLVDNSRMLADVCYEIAPLRTRLLEHINDARHEAALPPVGAVL